MSLVALIVSIIICPYFIIVTPRQYYLYSLTILLYLLASIGALFKIMHLPGGDELLMIGLVSNLLAGTFLIISGIKSIDKKFKSYKIILGILLITYLPVALSLWILNDNYYLRMVATIYPCAILLLVGWIIISKRTLHEGERNLLIVILAQSIVAIVGHLKMAPLT